MGIMKTENGDHVGRQSASLIPDYEIRYREFGKTKYYVVEKGTRRMPFASDDYAECEAYIKCSAELFKLTSKDRWPVP